MPRPHGLPGDRMRFLELRLPPVVVVLICGALMWGLAASLPAASVGIPAKWALALLLIVSGIAIGVRGVLVFRRHETTVHPSKPDAASAVVTTDIYRYTRNPMYLGLALVLLAWAVLLENLAAVAGVALFMAYLTMFQIRPEERALGEKFGAAYDDYRRTVRRWI